MTPEIAHSTPGETSCEMPLKALWHRRGISLTVALAVVLLGSDAALTGSYLMSVLVCPIWLPVSLVKNAIQRPAWAVALVRIAAPAVVLWAVLGNSALQTKVGDENSRQIIAACEEFRLANGRFPDNLDELVPRYAPSVPPARHSLLGGSFQYWVRNGQATLSWWVPPFRFYHFETRQWSRTD